LEKEIERLKKNFKKQKYGLIWADVPEAFEDDVENKLPILKEIPKLAIKSKDNKPTHLLIEGDNYHALTCLNYTHKGKIDVIYIDPPYNTGSDGFRYKDKRILDKFPDGTEVPKDSPYRHSYWLSFMRKRLELAKDLLKETGVIFISIGNDEIAQLKLLCDEIFGEKSENNVIHWKKNQKPQNASKTISESAEYLLVYFSKKPIKLVRSMTGTRTDEKGSYKPSPLFTFDKRPVRMQNIPAGTPIEAKKWEKGKIFGARNKLAYIEVIDIPIIKNGILQNDVRVNGQWRKTETNGEYQKVVKEGRLFINSNGFPNEKSYRDENSKNVHTNLWLNAGFNEMGKQMLDQIIGKANMFSYPKPVELVKEILKSINNPEAIVLDFFAGSGTAGQAVMEINEEDNGARQFILVTNNESNIMTEICYPRVKKIINGYNFKGNESVILYEKKLTFSGLKNSKEIVDELDMIESEKKNEKWKKFVRIIEENKIILRAERMISSKKDGLGNSVKYYKTAFVGKNNILNANDRDKLELAHNAGELLALAENTLDLVKENKWFQIFESRDQYMVVYFQEGMDKFDDFIEEVLKLKKPVAVYIFSWENEEAVAEFEDLDHIKVKTIPQPILEIYKQIYNLI